MLDAGVAVDDDQERQELTPCTVAFAIAIAIAFACVVTARHKFADILAQAAHT